jgi:hypothetical protein
MTDPHVRVVGHVVGHVVDLDGMRLYAGVDYDTVTIHAGVFVPGAGIRLESVQAEEFARLYVAACWEAARQSGTLTDAQRAEFRAAAEEMCLADCGGLRHDRHCNPPATAPQGHDQ